MSTVPLLRIGEAVMVLEAGEASGDHAVCEVDEGLIWLDEAFVKLRKA